MGKLFFGIYFFFWLLYGKETLITIFVDLVTHGSTMCLISLESEDGPYHISRRRAVPAHTDQPDWALN
ncbi:hypothetical protein RHMOL_Rhmol11G0165800 [Rhododendron molle]|uniref:Uncharacterized protein n=1 Tax=Rhododendron molle TaxID=49168 RepID=A0ACC0LU08_RHOML|nr:hypothetical protein RHMOL_Rhmol11G0165800 [Rhododendron molle]